MEKISNPHLLSAKFSNEDSQEKTLRPKKINQFIGQKKIIENLNVFIKSALIRRKPLDHLLLAGPPGLGKTTLAFIIANEMGVNIKATSAPIIYKAGDLASILTSLKENDVLFIDEIHRLSSTIEEILYPAMEDLSIDILIGQGVGTKSIKINLAPFTLIGATTRTGLLTAALRDRFGIPCKLDYYNNEDLSFIIKRSAKILGYIISNEACIEISQRARYTPRIANRLLRRIADFATVENQAEIDLEITKHALKQLDIDNLGLDKMDRKLLHLIIENYNGGPVGLKTIAISIGEEVDTIEEYYEPFLIQCGLLKRSSRGRMITKKGYEHLNLMEKYNSQSILTNINEQTLF